MFYMSSNKRNTRKSDDSGVKKFFFSEKCLQISADSSNTGCSINECPIFPYKERDNITITICVLSDGAFI